MSFKQLDRLALEAGIAVNDNRRKPETDEIEWSPRRVKRPRGTPITRSGDGPSPEQFIASGLAWYAGEPREAANDNWPLAKVLRRNGLDRCLTLAERYLGEFQIAHRYELWVRCLDSAADGLFEHPDRTLNFSTAFGTTSPRRLLSSSILLKRCWYSWTSSGVLPWSRTKHRR